MNLFKKSLESWGSKSPKQNRNDRERWKQDLKKKADEKYFSDGAAEGLASLKLGFRVPINAKLEKNYNRINGNLPGDNLVQWLLYLDYIYYLDGLLDLSEFNAHWQITPVSIRKALLQWYLKTISPMSKYHWKLDLPIDDPAFYSHLEKQHSNLVVLYPYVFLPKDVPFLFDSSISLPGSGKPDAYQLDAQKLSLAVFSSDLFASEDFAKAISNENPLQPTFENRNGVYFARIARELTKKREYNTADVVNMQSTDVAMALDRGAIDKMLEANKHKAEKRPIVRESSKDGAEVQTPVAFPSPDVKTEGNNDLYLTHKEAYPNSGSAPYLPPQPIDPTVVEKDMSETYWKEYNAQIKRVEPQKKFDLLNPDLDDIFPKIPLPKEGENLSIGSGVTQRILGSGGQGVVYLSWDNILELYRAIKLLKPPPTVVEPVEYRRLWDRFFREIKVQSNMNHGNLAQIYNFGEWNRYLFFEMEYIEGVDTKSLLGTSGKLSPIVAIAVLIQSLQGLHYAHNKSIVMDGKAYRGFIHRDIKPANVMISKEGYVKVLDFGIGIPVGMVSLTMQHGGLIGTAPYMSPEQVNGRELDHRSDLFSMGTVFYEMITGISAFGNGATIHEVMNNVIEGNYKKIDSFNIKIPKSMKYIIKKSLERDPNQRFESAAAMLSLCNEALRDLTKEIPEAVIQDFVSQQAFTNATSAQTITRPTTKKKWFFGR